MITTKFKLILLVAMFCYFAIIYYYLRRQKLILKYALVWILVGLALVILVIYPPLVPWATNILGMQSPNNLLFLIMIALILIIVMSLTAILSKMSDSNRRLAQRLALLEQKMDTLSGYYAPIIHDEDSLPHASIPCNGFSELAATAVEKIILYKRWIILTTIFLSVIAGFVLYRSTENLEITNTPSGGEVLSLEPGKTISEKFVGDDKTLSEISFFVIDPKISDRFRLHVYLTAGTASDTKNILYERILTSADLNSGEIILSPDCRLLYGRDYAIHFCVEEAAKIDRISLATSQNSLAYKALWIKEHTRWFFIYRLMLLLLSMAFATAQCLGINFYRALGIDVIADCMILYLIGVFDVFEAILPVFNGLTIISLLYLAYCALKNKLRIEAADIAQSIFFTALCAVFALLSRTLWVHAWDEMTHWAITVKNMYLWNKMPQHELYSSFVYRFPPVYSLFQLFFLKLNGSYNEQILYFSKYVLETMMGCSLLAGVKKQKRSIWFYLLSCGVVFNFPDIAMGTTGHFSNTLYADIPVGFAIGMVLVALHRFLHGTGKLRTISAWELFGSCFVCAAIKESGILFCMALLCGIGITLLAGWFLHKTFPFRQGNKALVFITAGLFLSRLSWSLYLSSRSQILKQIPDSQKSISAASRINMTTLMRYLSGEGKAYQYKLLWEHPKALLTAAYYQYPFFSLSFAAFLLLLSIAVWIGIKCCHKSVRSYLFDGLILFFTMIALITGYYLIYAFTYTEAEGTAMASEPRYLGSYLLGLCLYCIGCFSYRLPSKYQKYVFGILMFMVLLTGGSFLYRFQWAESSKSALDDTRTETDTLRQFLNEDDTVYYIGSGDNGGIFLKYCYLTTPIRWNNYFSWDANKEETVVSYIPRCSHPKEYERQMSYQELENTLYDYDYLYIEKMDMQFVADYGALFHTGTAIHNGGLYQIQKQPGGICLKEVPWRQRRKWN